MILNPCFFNTLRPRKNGRHFADDTFKRIFVNENIRILIEMSLKFVPKGPINNIPALVQVMAWRRPDDKPLSEPMMVCLPTHICVTRPQWVKPTWISNVIPHFSRHIITDPSTESQMIYHPQMWLHWIFDSIVSTTLLYIDKIPCHPEQIVPWHASDINPYGTETRVFRKNLVNTVAGDSLSSSLTRASAVLILNFFAG